MAKEQRRGIRQQQVDAEPHAQPDVFGALSPAEKRSLLINLNAILPARGCEQRCMGCHAAALPRVIGSSWSTVEQVVGALREESEREGIRVQQGQPGALIETFRDNDPAHLEIADGDRVRGLGDFTRLISEQLGSKTKVMTSGVRTSIQDIEDKPTVVLNPHDLEQLEAAAQYSGRMSVSMSIETTQYRKFGEDIDAQLLAATAEAMLRGRQQGEAKPQVFFDTIFASPDGQDSYTQDTIRLFIKTLSHVSDELLAPELKQVFLKRVLGTVPSELRAQYAQAVLPHADAASISDLFGQVDAEQPLTWTDARFFVDDEQTLGFRISPYLKVGRAARSALGQGMQEAQISADWMTILDGDSNDTLTIDGRSFSRGVLKNDLDKRHEFIDLLKQVSAGGYVKDLVTGDLLDFIRAEIDLKDTFEPADGKRGLLLRSPGSMLGPSINLILSDPAGNELQQIIPYAPLHLAER